MRQQLWVWGLKRGGPKHGKQTIVVDKTVGDSGMGSVARRLKRGEGSVRGVGTGCAVLHKCVVGEICFCVEANVVVQSTLERIVVRAGCKILFGPIFSSRTGANAMYPIVS